MLEGLVAPVLLLLVALSVLIPLALREPLRRRIPEPQWDYLTSTFVVSPIAAVLLLLLLYTGLKETPYMGWTVTVLAAMAVLFVMRCPRWIVYAVLICSLVLMIWLNVFITAEGLKDPVSDRDEDLETATTAFIHGDNPWGLKSPLGNPITSGPSGILLSLPIVALMKKINLLAFAGWCAFLGFAVHGDVARRNDTFFTVCLLMVSSWFGLSQTLLNGLDSLFWPAIITPLLWFSLNRKRYIVAGALSGFMVLFRLSYAPAVVAVVLWWLLRHRPPLGGLARYALGGFAYVVASSAVMWIRGGTEFLSNNFWTVSRSYAETKVLNDYSNPLSSSISTVLHAVSQPALLATALVVLLTVVAAIAMRRLEHPFFQMSVALLLANTIMYSPPNIADYQLVFLIPALYGVAYSRLPGERVSPSAA